MKTKLTHRILLVALALALLCGSALAAGAIKTQMIEANYMGIKLVVDGAQVNPTDATGRTVEPFASNGTTYLPVRAIGSALGKNVEWDGETKTVYIGDIPNKLATPYQVNNGTIFDGTDPDKTFSVAGQSHGLGVTLRSSRDWHAGGIYDAFAVWNTESKYRTMNVTVGHMGDNQVDATLEIYLDGVYSTSYKLPWSAAPKTLSIPLNSAPNVMFKIVIDEEGIEMTGLYSYIATYGIYDISFS